MAVVKITLTDRGGVVLIQSDPPMPKLSQMRKDKADTPAQGYALIALATVIKTSLKEAQDKMKEKMAKEKAIADQVAPIIMPGSERFRVQ